MKYGKGHKLKRSKMHCITWWLVGSGLKRSNLNSDLKHLKDLRPAVNYIFLMVFKFHKDYTNVKYVGKKRVLKLWEDSDRKVSLYSQKTDLSNWQASSLKPYAPTCLASVKTCPAVVWFFNIYANKHLKWVYLTVSRISWIHSVQPYS